MDAHDQSKYVLVYILESSDNSAQSEMVRHLFSDALFSTCIVKIDVPQEFIHKHEHLSPQDASELFQFRWCLSEAKKRSPDSHVIVVKDTSTSNADPKSIAEIVASAQQDNKWDICYLCKWMDRCDLYTDKTSISGKATIITKTYSPYGCQALLFSTQGRDMILGDCKVKGGGYLEYNKCLSETLNHNIGQRKIDATCIVPNLISFDLSQGGTDSDYEKLRECRDVEKKEQPSQGYGWGWLLMLAIIVIIIILLWYFFPVKSYMSRYCQ